MKLKFVTKIKFSQNTTIRTTMYSLLHVSVTSNHHQADISVQDMTCSVPQYGINIVYICCVEFQTLGDNTAHYFNILTNVLSDIIYEPIDVGLTDRPTSIGS
jgi:hypothetical protein